MDEPVITYDAARPDATPETEISALANVYRFVLDRHENRAAAENRPDDPERRSDEIRAKTRIL